MIEWEMFFLVFPLMLPEVAVTAVVIGALLRRRRSVSGSALPWLLFPTAFLGLASVARMLPLFFEPANEFVDAFGFSGDDGLMAAWYADLLVRIPAWAALLYGLFWKLPAHPNTPPLDPQATQTAATVALLAALLIEAKRDEAPEPAPRP